MSVTSVCASSSHEFSKQVLECINLVKDLGVEGDAHLGSYVQHRSRLHLRPLPNNLRQVHLIMSSTLQERNLEPGDIGENICTNGIDLLQLSSGTRLKFVWPGEENEPGPTVVITGLRNPCPQIEKFRAGLQETFIVRDGTRKIVGRLAGVMSTVEIGGEVASGMHIVVSEPAAYVPLAPV